MKTEISYLQDHSLRGLFEQVNTQNSLSPDTPILKEDIIQILHEEDTYILVYYK